MERVFGTRPTGTVEILSVWNRTRHNLIPREEDAQLFVLENHVARRMAGAMQNPERPILPFDSIPFAESTIDECRHRFGFKFAE